VQDILSLLAAMKFLHRILNLGQPGQAGLATFLPRGAVNTKTREALRSGLVHYGYKGRVRSQPFSSDPGAELNSLPAKHLPVFANVCLQGSQELVEFLAKYILITELDDLTKASPVRRR